MPDRIIRDELLESERWLSLKDNADRLAYLALLLRADSLGNFSADPFRLLRLWRDFGINTEPLVAKALAELADHDLIRLYEHDKKPLLHIPRFGQRIRYLTRVFPPSPWTTNEQKHKVMNKSPDSHLTVTGRAPAEVKRSEVKRSEVTTLASSDTSDSAVELIPLVGGREWPAPQTFVTELERAYPAVDGPTTLREIRAWCISNPQKRKTERGVKRFINRWFEKEQNRG